jgi:hypothetical protein
MEPEGSLYSQEPATGSYLEQAESNPQTHTYFCNIVYLSTAEGNILT